MATRHEAVFEQPDIPEDLDQLELQVTTTYHATATRTGKRWTATVQDLPDSHVIRVQGATWGETADNVMESVFDLFDPDPNTVGFYLTPADPEAAGALRTVTDARAARLYAEQAERDAVRNAARIFISQGWTTRDIGSALGLSHQRISQIVPRATM
ncbi:hypothetical protein [Streptosporangium sp. NBC_01756]|uniref:hypothetical protein n=1 Tax=Streptosporangium sp. NBC_01756 TaxID=2975950 RepID=UPI002DDC7F4B|nr:hypothetical protein [Streptosporangium sp. NBC_01756]WSC86211.1 hypothetical protein OIE48_38625 [Streptosporangium sp. NBC_01756]